MSVGRPSGTLTVALPPIAGSCDRRYTVRDSDLGHTLRVRLTVVEPGQTPASARSDHTAIVAAKPYGVPAGGDTGETCVVVTPTGPGQGTFTSGRDAGGPGTPLAPDTSPKLINPFPVARISGRFTRNGTKLTRVTVNAPSGARIGLDCKGRGCPLPPQGNSREARPGACTPTQLPARRDDRDPRDTAAEGRQVHARNDAAGQGARAHRPLPAAGEQPAGEMPDRLSLRSALLLIVLAFGLTFTIQALLGGGASAAKPLTAAGAPVSVAAAPGAEPNLSLAAAETVPALRNPRPPARKKRRVRKVRPVASVAPTPVASVSPTPTATPQYVPPAPKRTATPTPKPKPKPTSTPEVSSEFDTSGEGGS
jgi:hypothetical protein